MLLALTLTCVCLGMHMNRVHRQRMAAALVRQHHGKVYLESERPDSYCYHPGIRIWEMDGGGRSVRGPSFTPKASPCGPQHGSLSNVFASMRLQDVWYVDLADTELDELSSLREFRNLRWLNLCDARLADTSTLHELRSLKRLWLTGATLSDTQVQELRKSLPDCVIHWNDTPDKNPSPQHGGIWFVTLLPTE